MEEKCSPPAQPFDIEPLPGFRLRVRPITRFSMNVARQYADGIINDINQAIATLDAIGFEVDPAFDPENKVHVDAMRQSLFETRLAIDHILEWEMPDGQQLELTPAAVASLMNNEIIARKFMERVTEWHVQRLLAKKEFRTALNGKPAAAPNTAKDAG